MTKEVMQQALDALLGYKPHSLTHAKEQGSAIIALREALAQPVPPDPEPVMTIGFDESEKCRSLPFGMKLYDHPAQPVPPAIERNFCERCGKRLSDSEYIHTCTPPESKA